MTQNVAQTILVVDDDAAVRRLLHVSLDQAGFPVLEKEVAAGSTEFALRSDRLVAIAPARSHAVLLPLR